MRRTLNPGKILTLTTAFFAAVTVFIVCYFLRNEVLGCHDSFVDYVYGRTHSIKDIYISSLKFCLARGRVGFFFPVISTIRQMVLSTGNYYAAWFLQQIPIWFTVYFIGFVVARKTRPVYGFFFVIVFASLLQIDTNHNIMTCYPLDFMYGMSMMILGLYLYDSWFVHKGEKRNNIRLVVSLICYYASMQAYEPYITAGLIYALISGSYALKAKKDGQGGFFRNFILKVLPHFFVAVLFLSLLELLKIYPVVTDVPVTPVDNTGTLANCILTWKTFSFSLLPLSNTGIIDVGMSLKNVFANRYTGAFSVVSALGFLFFVLSLRFDFRKLEKEEQRKINKRLLILAAAGALHGLFFTLPHSMTENYQNWVTNLGATGYLTSSLCYFGWALFFACILEVILNLASAASKFIYIPVAILATAGAFVCADLTAYINLYYYSAPAATGQQMSYTAQAFYSLFASDYAEDEMADLVYVPDYTGLHGILQSDDDYADYEVGKDVKLVNTYGEFKENEESNTYETAGIFDYYPDVDAGYYANIDNPEDSYLDWVADEIVFVSTRAGAYVISYVDEDTGEIVDIGINADRLDTIEIEDAGTVDLDSLTIRPG